MIGIIGAMELEVETLKSKLTELKVTTHAGREFFTGRLNGKACTIVRCGIGKVNAALCVQALVDKFGVAVIINTGVAGALNNSLNIGDIVVSRDAVEHDVDVTPLGFARSVIPQLPTSVFTADEKLVKLAVETCRRVNPDIQVIEGRVVTGDQFIAGAAVKADLVKTFGGDCAEMEGGAIGHGAYLNQVPFVIIRALSDKADDTAMTDYPTFERSAAKHCATLVEAMAEYL